MEDAEDGEDKDTDEGGAEAGAEQVSAIDGSGFLPGIFNFGKIKFINNWEFKTDYSAD